MKKSLTLMLAIAMVFTMFASVAFAADNSTGTSLDANAKFNALKDAGIMTGTVVDGQVVAGLDLNMDRASFAEVLVNMFNLPKVATTSSFSDVPNDHWALQQIEAVKTAGYMVGNGDGTFNPDGKISLEELASAVDEANGLSAVANANVAGADGWAQGLVQAALDAKLLQPVADYTVAATRADLVYATYQTYQNVQAQQQASATFKATGASQITVTFNKAVDKSAATFAVKKGTLDISVASTTFADDSKSAVINLSTKMTKGDYTVTVSNPDLSGTVTVDDEAVSKITFNSDKAALDANDSSIVYAGLKIFNQYGEDITSLKTGEVKLTTGGGTATFVDNTGKIKIDSGVNFTLDQKVALSALDSTNGTFQSVVLTVSPPATAATISISKLYNMDDDTFTVSSDPSSYELVVSAKDQYGNDVSYSDLRDDVMVYLTNPIVGLDVERVGGAANGNPNFIQDTIDGVQQTVLKLAHANNSDGNLNAGTTQVVLISKTTGSKATFDITVADNKKVDVLNMSTPNIAVAGETIDIPVTATDQDGNAITDASDLNDSIPASSLSATVSGVAVQSGKSIPDPVFVNDYATGQPVLEVDTANLDTTNMTTAGNLFITATTGTYKVSTLSVSLQPPAHAVAISALTDDTKRALAVGATTTVDFGNLTVLDQYNRDYSFTGSDYQVKVATSNNSEVQITGATDTDSNGNHYVVEASDGAAVTLTGAAKGSATITVSLVKPGDDASVASNEIAGTQFSFNVRVVDRSSISDYSVPDIGTLYATNDSADYSKTVEVDGLLSDGTQVALPVDNANYYSVTVATYGNGIHYADGSINADATALAAGDDDITVPVTVIGKTDNGQKVVSKTVTVSSKAPEATTVALQDGTYVSKESDNVVSVSAANLHTLGSWMALANDAVEVTDQYGVDMSDGKLISAIATDLPQYTSGDNKGQDKALADITTNETFKVTAVTANGKPITFTVGVK